MHFFQHHNGLCAIFLQFGASVMYVWNLNLANFFQYYSDDYSPEKISILKIRFRLGRRQKHRQNVAIPTV